MPRKKNNYSAELKTEVVLEALEGEKTYQQIGLERGLDPQLIGNWVKQARHDMVGIFKRTIQNPETAYQKEINQLHQKIGQLTIENDFLKKASGKCK